MLTLESLNFSAIKQLEELRCSRVIVLAASQLEMDFLPQLYSVLQNIGRVDKLDVVLFGRGGEINAARRIGLLLRKFAHQLNFLVPHYCQSSCTVLSLCGDEIICGDLAIFSPIDPRMNAADSNEDGAPGALASEDIRLFNQMSQDWFGVGGEDVNGELLASLVGSIFPTTLTSLYRSNLELKSISEELLAFQLPQTKVEERAKIIEQLMFGYHSHSYALTAENLTELGLNVVRDETVETLAWQIACQLQSVIGGGAREKPEDPRNDVLIASREKIHIRQRLCHRISPCWKTIEVN